MKNRWILVCDASRAALFEQPAAEKEPKLLQSFEHAESRARARDLLADAYGRKPVGPVPARSGEGQGLGYGRPGAAPDTDAKDVEADKFARQLAEALERGLTSHAYDRLILVAAPRFLGALRSAINTQVEKHLEDTINKDLAGVERHELIEHLMRLLPADKEVRRA